MIAQVKKLPILGDLVTNILAYNTYKKYKPFLQNNEKYRDLHKGKRCFIIGNGPSLNKHDLTLLKDEITISVNSMTVTKEFDIVKPKYHVLVDPTRFDKNYPAFVENMQNLKKLNHKPVYVFPVRFKNFIEENKINEGLDIIYVQALPSVKKIEHLDFTQRVPPFQNVTNIALYLSIFLGCTEIYLIGCDMTSLVKTYDENMDFSYGGHFYNIESHDEKKTMQTLHEGRSNEFMLKAYGYVFELFRLTKEYADTKNIKILNATKGGTLDVFPWAKYESIFK